MIEVKELSKKIGNKQVLSNINLTIPKGSIYGIIGVNGAGKTTLIRHMVGAYQPDTGYVELQGNRVYENALTKEKLVYIPDEFPNTFGNNIEEIAKLYSSIYPSFEYDRYNQLMRLFNKNSLENFHTFSKGMKKQVVFILALSIQPEYLIMDEPFDGLDPQVRKQIWDILIEDVTNRAMTIFISSHHLKELDSMCDRIALMDDGRIVFEKGLEDLKDNFHKLQIVLDSKEAISDLVKELKTVHHSVMGRIHTIIVEGDRQEIEERVNVYNPIINEVLPLNLEEIFLFTLGGIRDELMEIMD